MASFKLKKDSPKVDSDVVEYIADDKEFDNRWPIVYAYLYQDRYESGGFRQTATLLFFLEHGGLKVCLHDREGHRSLFRRSTSLYGCLDALEEALSNDTADWKAKRI